MLLERKSIRWTLWILAASWFFWPLLSHPFDVGLAHDWPYLVEKNIAFWRSVAEHHEIPQWDPYYCGGIPALGSLNDTALSPLNLFSIVLGPFRGPRLAWLCLIIFGLEGSYRLARLWGCAVLGAILAAFVFSFSGRFTQSFADGHMMFLAFQWLPWLLYTIERSLDDRRWVLLSGAVATCIFCENGAVATPIVAVTLVLWGIARSIYDCARTRRLRSAAAPWLCLVGAGAVAAGLSAPRLLFVVDSLVKYPRLWTGPDGYSARLLGQMLATPALFDGYFGAGTAYVGLLVLFMAAWGLLRKRPVVLAIMAAICVDLCLGSQGLCYAVVKRIPVLGNIRCFFRFTFPLTLLVSIAAGLGLTAVEEDLAKFLQRAKWRRLQTLTLLIPLALGLAVGRQGLAFSRNRLSSLLLQSVGTMHPGPFKNSIGNRWHAHAFAAANLGIIGCFEEQPFPNSPALRGDLVQEEYLADSNAGTVERVSWSPHHIVLKVQASVDSLLVVNQNADAGWRTSVGAIAEHEGLLAVRVPKGSYEMEIRYLHPYVVFGGLVTLATCFGAVGWLLWMRRRRKIAQVTR